jgi:hypothetical protein
MSALPVAPPSPPKRPIGRPPYAPTDEARKMVRLMVAGGILQEKVAGALGISQETLAKHFRAEIDNGKIEIDTLSVGTVIATMREGGKDALTAATWWQKSRMGWSEKAPVDDDVAKVPLRVIIELVGSPAPAQVTHQPARSNWKAPADIELVGN